MDPTFRKASLFGALASQNKSPSQNQLKTFKLLTNRIDDESKFSDVVKHVKDAILRNEDPLEHVGWMNGLLETDESCNVASPIENYGHLLDSITHNVLLEAAFVHVKSKFCREVSFGDVEERYVELVDKYRKVRKQYTDGMLSLHSAL